MLKNLIKLMIMTNALILPPLVGVFLYGKPVEKYLEFPPITHYVRHAPFSWLAFFMLALFILVVTVPLFLFVKRNMNSPAVNRKRIKLPWWGKAGFLLMILCWMISWSDWDKIAILKKYIFPALWLSFILVVNSLEYRRTGKCTLLTTNRFLLLFPLSAAYWWYFEYLNSFVENWYYLNRDVGTRELFIFSSLAFSTVLPAVISTNNLISNFIVIEKKIRILPLFTSLNPKLTASAVLVASVIGLACMGIFPEYLFPLVWISPLLIIVSIQSLFDRPHIFSGLAEGNLNPIISSALAALICGVFWETWNYYSMPKWQYSIPYLDAFRIFEMPVLGYSGYLPFGLLCVTMGEMIGMRTLGVRS
jgi:hypothetical protein